MMGEGNAGMGGGAGGVVTPSSIAATKSLPSLALHARLETSERAALTRFKCSSLRCLVFIHELHGESSKGRSTHERWALHREDARALLTGKVRGTPRGRAGTTPNSSLLEPPLW